MAKNILITGASGLIGSRLTQLLVARGHNVCHLGRSKRSGDVPAFVWDIDLGILDPRALAGTDTIIHLAGAGIADRRWTSERKHEILTSRTKSTELLYGALKKGTFPVKAVIAASATGYYGIDSSEHVFIESDPAGTDFLANVCRQWEEQEDKMASLGIRVAKIRTGIVLSRDGGALKPIASTVKLGVGSPLGTGSQMLSWIHIDDLCRLFCTAAEEASYEGAFNGTAPVPVSNEALTQAVAHVLHRPLWLPNVPAFALKLVLGEMASLVLTGNKVSSAKAESSGFTFLYPDLTGALKNLYNG